MSISAMLPVFEELDGWWICQSRCLCSHGQGTITGTGATRNAATQIGYRSFERF